MTELRQREEPIRSMALRRAAAGQTCTLNLPGICNYDPSTVVLAHIHDEQFGKSEKADDTSGMHCCFACHTAYDLHQTGLDELTLLKLVFRAYQRTIRRLVKMEAMKVRLDRQRTFAERPTPSRKPPEERAPIRSNPEIKSRPTKWASRTMESANNLRRERKSK